MLRVFVSSCLLGAPVRYHGGHARHDHPILERWIREGRLITSCPEMAADLGTPRPPAEIVGGEVVTSTGEIMTAAYRRGAEIIAEQAAGDRIAVAILRNGSPSCGSTFIYDGTFTGTTLPGEGITAALLRSLGVAVFDEKRIEEAARYLAALEAP
jgi:uncharacterized protein YbbK (DUF523 family)